MSEGVALEWARSSGWTIVSTQRSPSVFFSVDPDHASLYADRAASVRGDKPVILEIRVPESKIVRDEDDENGWRFEGRIPPSWIHVRQG